MHDKFSWAYIGSGSIADITAKKILKTSRHRITSVYSRTFSNARHFAAKYNAKACLTLEEAVDRPDVHAVYICTVANNHFESARKCLELGKPVLLEKPFTVNSREAMELKSIAEKNNVYLAEAMWTWFSPVARQAKTWIEQGRIGDVQSLRAAFSIPTLWTAARAGDANRAGGALLDLGVYPIAYSYYLLGYPSEIHCDGIVKHGVDVSEKIRLVFANDVQAHLSSSIRKLQMYRNLSIEGSEGRIFASSFHSTDKIFMKNGQNNRKKIEIYTGNGGYDNQFDIVASEIRGGLKQSPLVPLTSTIDIMIILDECRQQMRLKYPFEEDK